MSFLKKINYFLAVIPVLLFSLGYVIHLSTSQERASLQLIFFVIAYTAFWVVSVVDYHLLVILHKRLYFLIAFLLVLVLVLGKTVLGSVRWLSFGFLNFQPSEFAKFALVVYIAFYLAAHPRTVKNYKELLRLALPVLGLILLVILQPDLGSSIVLFFVFAGMLFVGGLNWLYFFFAICFFGVLSNPIWNLLKDYQKHRIMVFLNPSLDTLGKGYNVLQSLISIGSGGFFGKGFGHGSQSHLNFLPIYWTDFIFAAFAEEWGFIGVFVLLSLFCTLFCSILYCALKASDRLGALLSFGVLIVVFSQFVINIGMNMGLLPVTGIPLPLVSYGGTSMLTTALLLGLAHSVWLHRKHV